MIAKEKQETPEWVLISTRTMNRAEVNQAIRDGGLSGLHQIRSIVQIDRLPVLGTGKIDYWALENMVKSS